MKGNVIPEQKEKEEREKRRIKKTKEKGAQLTPAEQSFLDALKQESRPV